MYPDHGVALADPDEELARREQARPTAGLTGAG